MTNQQSEHYPVVHSLVIYYLIQDFVLTLLSTRGSPEGSDASIDFEVSYDEGRRGAILVMYSPRETNLPNTVPLAKLASAKEMKKNGKVLVTSVVSCPAFTLQVSDAST